MTINATDLKSIIRDVPDFPKKGIIFKDITPLLKDAQALQRAVDELAVNFEDKKVDYVLGIESRGFIFSPVLAYKMNAGFIPVRKKGKLPAKTEEIAYALEYGEAVLEIHSDALEKGSRVLIVDDLLATGGTALAAAKLVERLGGTVVGIGFLIELEFLKGREKISSFDIHSLIRY
ncbi:MAG: adenine phosphoribosyltransferase [Candidatus Omnitrophica bacterium]|nr:adenine phosphoribosyltransferase [Candidatus Omnitrophota bacterium]